MSLLVAEPAAAALSYYYDFLGQRKKKKEKNVRENAPSHDSQEKKPY